LGEALFLEDFDIPAAASFFFANGAEGELGIGRESQSRRTNLKNCGG
jgi:hypothetical protein